jgi:hypothetical protein
MISRLTIPVTLGILFAVAFAIGAFTAQTALATNNIYLQIQGGTAAGTAQVYCGWHGECTDPPTSGNALDWTQSGGTAVYFDSYAYYTSYSTIAGTGNPSQNNGDCKSVDVWVKRPNGTSLGHVYYAHSDVYSTSQFNINATYVSLTWTLHEVATTASSELSNCVSNGYWSGPHLHQNAGSPFGTHWSQFPYAPYSRNNVDVTSTSEYQQYVTFEY